MKKLSDIIANNIKTVVKESTDKINMVENLQQQSLSLYGNAYDNGIYSAKKFAEIISDPKLKEAVEKLEGIKQVVKQGDTIYWSDIKHTLPESLKLMQSKQMTEGVLEKEKDNDNND